MSLFDSFKTWVVGDEEDEDEIYEEETVVEEEPAQREPEYAHPRTDRQPQAAAPARQNTGVAPQSTSGGRVVNISATTKLAVVLVRAEQFNSVVDIADHLKNKMTVVLNLETTEKEVATRMLDFLSGVTYAIEGKVKRVAKDTYLITPYNVEIMGEDLISELENNGLHL